MQGGDEGRGLGQHGGALALVKSSTASLHKPAVMLPVAAAPGGHEMLLESSRSMRITWDEHGQGAVLGTPCPGASAVVSASPPPAHRQPVDAVGSAAPWLLPPLGYFSPWLWPPRMHLHVQAGAAPWVLSPPHPALPRSPVCFGGCGSPRGTPAVAFRRNHFGKTRLRLASHCTAGLVFQQPWLLTAVSLLCPLGISQPRLPADGGDRGGAALLQPALRLPGILVLAEPRGEVAGGRGPWLPGPIIAKVSAGSYIFSFIPSLYIFQNDINSPL